MSEFFVNTNQADKSGIGVYNLADAFTEKPHKIRTNPDYNIIMYIFERIC